MIKMLDNLSISKFTAYFQVTKDVNLPFYTGSTFRGVLGRALHKVNVGLCDKDRSDNCSARYHCENSDLYAYLFETSSNHALLTESLQSRNYQLDSYPQPLIIDPPKGGPYREGEFLSLSFTLVGQAIAYFPFVVCALVDLRQIPIGRDSGRISLHFIENGIPSPDGSYSPIYDNNRGEIMGSARVLNFNLIHQWVKTSYALADDVDKIAIHFLTPFRFKTQNRFGAPLTFNVFMRNIFRRIELLSVHSPLNEPIDHKRLLELAESVKIEGANLRWHDWQRYSQRQDTAMKLGGVVGKIAFCGNLYEFLPFLTLCEYLNVGKGGTFGLGKYKMLVL
jgi:hypothetical protein